MNSCGLKLMSAVNRETTEAMNSMRGGVSDFRKFDIGISYGRAGKFETTSFRVHRFAQHLQGALQGTQEVV